MASTNAACCRTFNSVNWPIKVNAATTAVARNRGFTGISERIAWQIAGAIQMANIAPPQASDELERQVARRSADCHAQ